MKIEINVGDKVKVLKGKAQGTEAVVVELDKKNKRAKLEGVKTFKVKTKKGDSKDVHGTYALANLAIVKEEPKQEAAAEEAPAEATEEAAPAEEKTEEAAAE